MPGAKNPPKYRRYGPKNLAVVRIDRRDIYLGKYDSPESWEKYGRVLAEWRAHGIAPPAPARDGAEPGGPSVNEVTLTFWRHAEDYYRHADGTPTGELDNLRLALRPLRELYGGTPARDFGPKALKAVRQAMIDAGLCRRTVNQRIGRIMRLFRFAVENELVPTGVLHGLKAVAGLKSGRSGAKESRTVRPVPDAHVEAVKPLLSRQLRAVVELQRLTGMRSGEALIMRTGDVDTSGEVWEYVPSRHKTQHHGKRRRIWIGPQAQEALRPWLRLAAEEYLFQPREAMEEYQAQRRGGRRTPLTPSQRARTRAADPKRAPGERYDTRTYAHAVARACRRAGVPHWHPHQLRHHAATRLRREFGLEAARVILGHSSPAVTEVYAEADREKARDVVGKVG
jgi:integrase